MEHLWISGLIALVFSSWASSLVDLVSSGLQNEKNLVITVVNRRFGCSNTPSC